MRRILSLFVALAAFAGAFSANSAWAQGLGNQSYAGTLSVGGDEFDAELLFLLPTGPLQDGEVGIDVVGAGDAVGTYVDVDAKLGPVQVVGESPDDGYRFQASGVYFTGIGRNSTGRFLILVGFTTQGGLFIFSGN